MRPPVTATPSSNTGRRARNPWTPEEDQLLINVVNELGPAKWHIIANHIPGRSGQSCRSRWHYQLKAQVNTERFTGQANVPLLENRWSVINEPFVYQTDNQIQDQHNLLVRNDCYEFSNPSPFTNSGVTLNRGMTTFSSYSPPPVAIGPQSSLFSGLGNEFVFGSQSAHPRGMPSGGGSSALPRGRSPLPPQHTNSDRVAHLLNTLTRERAHMMARSANVQPCPETQPQPEQGSVVEEHKFFDFMGVGTSK